MIRFCENDDVGLVFFDQIKVLIHFVIEHQDVRDQQTNAAAFIRALEGERLYSPQPGICR
jgi:hypothetical protein